jgi:hypothetical protein
MMPVTQVNRKVSYTPAGAAQPRVRVTGRRPLAIKLSTCRHRFHRSYLLRAESRWRG